MNYRSLLALAVVATVVTGCLVPEKFAAKASFQPDGSYVVSYDGTAVHALAAMQIMKAGKLNAKDEAALENELTKLKKNADVKSVSYKNDGLYALSLEAKRTKAQTLDLVGIVKVSTGKDGVITLSSPELTAKDKKGLSRMGIKVDGTLNVSIPKNAEVVTHNATGTPSFLGTMGTYSWKIGSTDQRPLIKFRLK